MTALTEGIQYYVLWFRLDQKDRYLLWFSDGDDGVWTLSGRTQIPYWSTERAAREYAISQNLPLKVEEPKLHDLDHVEAFIRGTEKLDPDEGLNAWNLFVDVASSVDERNFMAVDRQHLDVYNHLFYLSGAAACVTSTQAPPPSLSELESLRRMLSLGLHVLRSRLTSMAYRPR